METRPPCWPEMLRPASKRITMHRARLAVDKFVAFHAVVSSYGDFSGPKRHGAGNCRYVPGWLRLGALEGAGRPATELQPPPLSPSYGGASIEAPARPDSLQRLGAAEQE